MPRWTMLLGFSILALVRVVEAQDLSESEREYTQRKIEQEKEWIAIYERKVEEDRRLIAHWQKSEDEHFRKYWVGLYRDSLKWDQGVVQMHKDRLRAWEGKLSKADLDSEIDCKTAPALLTRLKGRYKGYLEAQELNHNALGQADKKTIDLQIEVAKGAEDAFGGAVGLLLSGATSGAKAAKALKEGKKLKWSQSGGKVSKWAGDSGKASFQGKGFSPLFKNPDVTVLDNMNSVYVAISAGTFFAGVIQSDTKTPSAQRAQETRAVIDEIKRTRSWINYTVVKPVNNMANLGKVLDKKAEAAARGYYKVGDRAGALRAYDNYWARALAGPARIDNLAAARAAPGRITGWMPGTREYRKALDAARAALARDFLRNHKRIIRAAQGLKNVGGKTLAAFKSGVSAVGAITGVIGYRDGVDRLATGLVDFGISRQDREGNQKLVDDTWRQLKELEARIQAINDHCPYAEAASRAARQRCARCHGGSAERAPESADEIPVEVAKAGLRLFAELDELRAEADRLRQSAPVAQKPAISAAALSRAVASLKKQRNDLDAAALLSAERITPALAALLVGIEEGWDPEVLVRLARAIHVGLEPLREAQAAAVEASIDVALTLKVKEGAPVLKLALESGDRDLVRRAATTLKAVDAAAYNETLQVVSNALANSETEDRRHAAAILRDLGPHARPARAALEAAVEDEDATVQRRAREALEQQGGGRSGLRYILLAAFALLASAGWYVYRMRRRAA